MCAGAGQGAGLAGGDRPPPGAGASCHAAVSRGRAPEYRRQTSRALPPQDKLSAPLVGDGESATAGGAAWALTRTISTIGVTIIIDR